MIYKRGITLGKFAPLHKGHELLLETAVAHCQHLVVLIGVTPQDTIPYGVRRAWVQELVGNMIRGTGKTIVIRADPDPDPVAAKDAVGTITDESFWTQWLEQNSDDLNAADVVFTSDRYGAEIARRTNTVWHPVDPDREVFQISSTKIRAGFWDNYNMIADVAKPYMGVTVAVLGAESTGKSTMVKNLAAHFKTTYAPEWGRIICEAKPDLDYDDFTRIVEMQKQFIRRAQINGTGLCFADTEAVITSMFAPIYLNRPHKESLVQARDQKIDLYLVLAPTVPRVQDGTRVLDDVGRMKFHKELLNTLTQLQKPYMVVEAVDFEERTQYAIATVDEFVKQTKGEPYDERDRTSEAEDQSPEVAGTTD